MLGSLGNLPRGARFACGSRAEETVLTRAKCGALVHPNRFDWAMTCSSRGVHDELLVYSLLWSYSWVAQDASVCVRGEVAAQPASSSQLWHDLRESVTSIALSSSLTPTLQLVFLVVLVGFELHGLESLQGIVRGWRAKSCFFVRKLSKSARSTGSWAKACSSRLSSSSEPKSTGYQAKASSSISSVSSTPKSDWLKEAILIVVDKTVSTLYKNENWNKARRRPPRSLRATSRISHACAW